jgi:hypothetical protein
MDNQYWGSPEGGTGIYRWYPGACTYSMGRAGVSMGPTPIPPSPLYRTVPGIAIPSIARPGRGGEGGGP